MSNWLALGIAVLALGFTVASFWWLHARRGKIVATAPRTYAFADVVRLRLPLAFFNTGAVDLVVVDLRVVVVGEGARGPLPWITTRTKLRPESDDGFAFATPFAVAGRSTREMIAEFGEDAKWNPPPVQKYRLTLEAQIHPRDAWVPVAEFDWWAPRAATAQYIVHRNEPEP